MDPVPVTDDALDTSITTPSAPVIDAVARTPGSFAVLGAGGKMGFHVCRMLQRSLRELGRKDRLTAISRFSSPAAADAFDAAGISRHCAELSDPDQVERLPDADNVVFLAGVKFGTSASPSLLRRMNVEVPQLVAARYHVSRIVALSTGCVYSFVPVDSGGASESSDTNPPGQYAQSCLGRERAFREGSQDRGTPITLIRLNYSVDLRYGVLVDLATRLMQGKPIPLETGHVNLIWQGDAVSQILQSFPLASSPPQILNVTGSYTLSVRQLALDLAMRLDRDAKFTGAESPTAWLSDNRLAVTRFGPPPTSVEKMIAWTAGWMSRGGKVLGKPTHFQNRDGDF